MADESDRAHLSILRPIYLSPAVHGAVLCAIKAAAADTAAVITVTDRGVGIVLGGRQYVLAAAEPERVRDEVDVTYLEVADDTEASARALFDAGEQEAAIACVALCDAIRKMRRRYLEAQS